MKYSISYHSTFSYFDEIDEVRVIFDDKNNHLVEFLEDKDEKTRYVVDITRLSKEEDVDIKLKLAAIAMAKQSFNNLAVLITLEQREYIEFFKKYEIDYFFNYFVDTWEKLDGVIALGASECYIVNEFAFELPKIKQYVPENFKLRTFANIAQTTFPLKEYRDPFKAFYVRPEDVDYIEKFVDTLEFSGSLDRHSILYKIYKQKSWLGNLNELILGIEEDIPNKNLIPNFAEERLSPAKKYYYRRILQDRVKSFAQTLDKADLTLATKE